MAYQSMIDILEAELQVVSAAFGTLAGEDWHRPTRLLTADPSLQSWTVIELAGHLDIAIARNRVLIAGKQDAEPAMDGTSFFISAGCQIAPVFYANACRVVEGKTPADVLDRLAETFSATITEARAVPVTPSPRR
jgi:hypothetical protein